MPTEKQKQALVDANTQIRSAEQLLKQASDAASDPGILAKIGKEYNRLDCFLYQLSHAQTIDDDDDFTSATTALKQQAATLQADQAAIEKIVGDVKTAADISGYIADALKNIAKLL